MNIESKPDQSEIVRTDGGTSYVGKDAVSMFRTRMLVSALRMYSKSGMIATRGLTPTKMLKLATEITRKPYKRGEYLVAADDLQEHAETLLLSLPVTDKRTESDSKP